MKKQLIILISAVSISMLVPVALRAQQSDKELKKELKQKADSDSKKTAKQLVKEGWKSIPGKLPLARQVMEAKYAELMEDAKGQPAYFIGSHQAIGGSYAAAKQVCDSRAYTEVAQQISTSVAKIVKDQLSSRNLGDGDLELIDETITASKSLISARMTGVKPILEIYRNLPDYRVKFHVVIAAPYAETMKIAKSVLLPEIKKKSETLAAEVDTIL